VRGDRFDIAYVGFVLGHGGDALQMLALAHGMHGLGARVKIVVPDRPETELFQQRSAALGIECERTRLITADLHGSRQRLASVVRLLRSLNAPIVHFHTGNSCLPRIAMVGLEAVRARPAVVTLQSPYETIAPESARARFWAVTAARRFAAVVSPSSHGTQFQLRCGIPADLAVTVPNAVDVEAMGDGDGSIPRRALGVDSGALVVLFSSRVERQKRPLDAVRAFAKVAGDHPDAILVFVGNGPEEEAVRAESARLGVDGRVRLVGYQTNVADWLAAADVWVLPTERENFSIAVLEALAAGCPVLATSCPGNDEVLVDEGNALTFPVGDVDAAARGLSRLLADPALRAAIGQGGRSTARAYAVETMVERYRRLYERAALIPACLHAQHVTQVGSIKRSANLRNP
jgi:glycosyltransferase involved in cell wall biosynthesis